jgi:outer membrane protein assembly factor BamB
VKWVTKLASGNFGELAADASGSVYVSASLGGASSDTASDGALLARVDGMTGALEWSTTFGDAMSTAPLLLSAGGVDFLASDPSNAVLIDRIDANRGAVTSSSLMPGGWYPAVGADGALYTSTSMGAARVAPDGTASWQSAPTLGGVSTIALGPGDLVLLTVAPSDGVAALLALDPVTGAIQWTQPWQGALAGPIVCPDGSVAVLAGSVNPGAASLLVFESTGAPRAVIALEAVGITLVEIAAVAQDGSYLLLGYDAAKDHFLVHLTSTGQLAWKAHVPSGFFVMTTIDLLGTVVAVSPGEILGLALTTGEQIWSLSAVGGGEIWDATLTSTHGIVGLETDGTLFGASD